MNITTTALFNQFPNVTILPTFGNHDYSPANAFDKNSVLYSTCWELWKKQIDAAEKVIYAFSFIACTVHFRLESSQTTDSTLYLGMNYISASEHS